MRRFDYVRYDEETQKTSMYIRDQILEVEKSILELGQSREASLAITKLEECYMWIGKHLKNKVLEKDASVDNEPARG